MLNTGNFLEPREAGEGYKIEPNDVMAWVSSACLEEGLGICPRYLGHVCGYQ